MKITAKIDNRLFSHQFLYRKLSKYLKDDFLEDA
jgi:hypothetical protein